MTYLCPNTFHLEENEGNWTKIEEIYEITCLLRGNVGLKKKMAGVLNGGLFGDAREQGYYIEGNEN